MLIKAQKDVTRISDNEKINNENYMESLNYIDNLYRFVNKLKVAVSTKNVSFLPTFKGKYTAEKLQINSTCHENEMKIFKVKSDLFFEDKVVNKVKSAMKLICEEVILEENIMTFILN